MLIYLVPQKKGASYGMAPYTSTRCISSHGTALAHIDQRERYNAHSQNKGG